MLEQKAAGASPPCTSRRSTTTSTSHPTSILWYQTARHFGVEIVKNLMVDAKTTSRWYFVIAMGRKAGHLAIGMGKAAGATLTLISEEFPQPPIRLKEIVDTLVGAIIKRLSYGRRDGVAIIAEGVVMDVAPADLEGLHGKWSATRTGTCGSPSEHRRDPEPR
jgi:6-phosphofructokinase 1